MKFKTIVRGVVAFAVCYPAHARADKPAEDLVNLVKNADFRQHPGNHPDGYQVSGSAAFGNLSDARNTAGWGVALKSGGVEGEVSQVIDGVNPSDGRWFRFTFRGLPERNFAVTDDELSMKLEFFGSDGVTAYDAKSRKIFPLIEQARKDLDVNGVRNVGGAEVWRTYQLDFVIPFPQVRRLKLSAGFKHGVAVSARDSDFLVTDFSLVRIPDPVGADATTRPTSAVIPVHARLVPLGGRWFYAATSAAGTPPAIFDNTNTDRLLYHDAGYSAPFAGNCTAWLHKGNQDIGGNVATAERFVADNVTIHFESKSLVMRTHGLPNHPTGLFPGLNPSRIQEQSNTFYLPLEPSSNPRHVVTTADNSNHALPMGPIGVAINGVVFFNPFDANSEDAANLMDRCCGHPNPFGQYHYHKYPICVNSPWADEGAEHSPLIGFAFDGFPVYGPYESKDVMAKDLVGDKALNDFNMHYDADRGWHYHVTPGKFPYIIGGYWGTEDSHDVQRGPRGGRGMRGGPGGGGPPGGGAPGGRNNEGGGNRGRFGPPPDAP